MPPLLGLSFEIFSTPWILAVGRAQCAVLLLLGLCKFTAALRTKPLRVSLVRVLQLRGHQWRPARKIPNKSIALG